MKSIYLKEITYFFSRSTGSLIVILFLLFSGLIFFGFKSDLNILNNGIASLESFFALAPIMLSIFIPLLSMHIFAEEYSLNTIEILLTKPITIYSIVLAKFFAILTVIFLSIFPTFIYVLTIYFTGDQIGNIDISATFGSYFGLFLISSLFTSISIFCSSFTKNQIFAFITSFVTILIFYFGFDIISRIDFLKDFNFIIYKMGISSHYKYISRAFIRFEDVFYFFSVSLFFIHLTKNKLLKKL